MSFIFSTIINLENKLGYEWKYNEENNESIKTEYNDFLLQEYTIRARIHKIRSTGKRCFLVFRQNGLLLQGLINRSEENRPSFNKLKKTSVESTIILTGKFKPVPPEQNIITSCHIKKHEFLPTDFTILTTSETPPIQVNQIDNSDKDYVPGISRSIELDHRCIALRAHSNIELFKFKSAVKYAFIKLMEDNNFINVDFSKLIPSASEGGSDVFEVKYFDKKVYLSQSPQLYKQMAINSDFNKVYTIGSVYRAENSIGHNHLCEFTGFDFEMEIDEGNNFMQPIKILWKIISVMASLSKKFGYEIKKIPEEPIIITFIEACELIGRKKDNLADFNREDEKKIGDAIKKKYNSDLVVVTEYPYDLRPFYTMKIKNTENTMTENTINKDGVFTYLHSQSYSYSYDLIFCGVEISSGAQREHRLENLIKQIKEKDIDIEKLKGYIDSFRYGTVPHGGAGIGFERVIALLTNTEDVRYVSFTPRDPKRISP